MDKRKGESMKILQKYSSVYEQLKCFLKREIVIREKILSVLKQDSSSSTNLSDLITLLKSINKKKQSLLKDIVQFSPLSMREIPIHSIVDIDDACELDLLMLIKKTRLLKKEMIQKNLDRKTNNYLKKALIPQKNLQKKLTPKKIKTLVIETRRDKKKTSI